ncbi:MAG TPA: hypothetical protein VM431_10795 [Phycisphaerae bacterium]|nr:hypothetical protein [Phycisphaerae bacterium]
MRRLAAVAVALLGAALAAGCFEGKADVTLNGDGKGKIVGEMTFQDIPPWTRRKAGGDAQATDLDDPATRMKEIVSKILKSSRGIKAWKDVSFKRLEDQRIWFRGTAYFEDLSAVKIWPDDAKTRAAFGPEGDKVLVLVLNRPGADADDGKRKSSRTLDAERLANRIKNMRADYREARGPVGIEVGSMKLDLRFELPALPAEVQGLEQQGHTVVFSTTGNELLRHMDSMVADNTYLRDLSVAKQSLGRRMLGKVLSAKVFSQKGEVWARVPAPARDRFDYAAEVEAAKAAQKDMLVQLGLAEAKPSSRSSKTPSGGRSAEDDGTKDGPGKGPSKPDPSRPPSLPVPKKLPRIPAPILLF